MKTPYYFVILLKNSSYIAAFLTTTFVLSCEKYLDFDAGNKTPKIVVNSKITSDSTFTVHLSRSLSVVDNAQLDPITNATLSIYDNNNTLIETLSHISDGFYTGTAMPTSNQNYQIKVSAPNFADITSKTYIPLPVSILNVDTLGYINAEGDSSLRLRISFIDNGSTQDYYQITWAYAQEFTGITYYNAVSFQSSDISLNLGQNEATQLGFFTDELFNGTTKTLEITGFDFRNYADYILISITNVSKELYLYDKSLQIYSETNGDFFAEPTQVFNNIEGGFGIFGGYNTTRVKINL